MTPFLPKYSTASRAAGRAVRWRVPRSGRRARPRSSRTPAAIARGFRPRSPREVIDVDRLERPGPVRDSRPGSRSWARGRGHRPGFPVGRECPGSRRVAAGLTADLPVGSVRRQIGTVYSRTLGLTGRRQFEQPQIRLVNRGDGRHNAQQTWRMGIPGNVRGPVDSFSFLDSASPIHEIPPGKTP
jgi:hypothetical protein